LPAQWQVQLIFERIPTAMSRSVYLLLICLVACHPAHKAVQLTDMQKNHDPNTRSTPAQKDEDPLLTSLLSAHPEYFDSILKDQNEYGVQIIYTEINRGKNNVASLTDHFFRTSDDYFYPASTVKFPVALLALEKLNALSVPGLDRNTPMVTEKAYSGQSQVYNDPTTVDGSPTIAQYIRKIFLVSDNDAFNRLYEFLGQQYINERLHEMGFTDVQILHRLNIFLSEDENRHTNPVTFYDSTGKIIYSRPMEESKLVYAARNDKKGKGYYSGDKLVNEPFDFSKKNRLSLKDLHSILKAVYFPSAVNKKQRFHLSDDDYAFVQRYMSMFPGESVYPPFDTAEYNDSNVKFLLWGGKEKPPPQVRIFSKSGDAYGFLTDVAYVVDFENNIEFMLSATIHCNRDGIYNDDHYDYDDTGLPFMKHLGEVIYQYELTRERKNKPDLSALKFDYRK
jgi:hypothetical protein